MSPTDQRVAIAEACGFKREERGYGAFTRIEDGEEWSYAPHDLPDYLTDLNAMHEAEKILQKGKKHEYTDWLKKCCPRSGRTDFLAFHATAAQRAEAFLRTIGKWQNRQQGGAE